MDIALLNKAVDEARGIPFFGEFEALQAVVNAQVLRSLVFPGEVNRVQLYNWYVERLLKLHNELLPRVNHWSVEMFGTQESFVGLLSTIQAILKSFPDTVW